MQKELFSLLAMGAFTLASIVGTDLCAATPLTLTEVASGLNLPVFLTSPPDDLDRQFVVEQGGRIRIIKLGTLLVTPYLDISSRVLSGGERGLLSLAFHPDYAANGFFYVYYTAASPSGRTTVSRFNVTGDADIADASSETIILTQTQPYANHNGGMIAFGPNDGFLYIGLGDGGAGGDPNNSGQDGLTLLGKMLRIVIDDGPSYSVPLTNPFTDDESVLDEVWALGLRNPWRFSFDRLAGDLWIADVGQSTWEEVDFQPAASGGGENYGWRLKEGDHCYNPSTNCDPSGILDDPIYEYQQLEGPWGAPCSITGGYVYRGCAIPDLVGTYVFADYCTGEIWSFQYDGANVVSFTDRTNELTAGSPFQVSSFGEDARGELYLMDYLFGRVLKIVPDGVPDSCESDACCNGRVGDANDLGGDEPTIGDVQVMIDAKFISLTCGGLIACLEEADINQSGGSDPTCDDITIGDISILIDYLFITGPSLGLAGCL